MKGLALVRVLPVLRWALGTWLGLLGMVLALKGLSVGLAVLGLAEAVAAFLFVWRRTVVWGGFMLLLVLFLATGVHLGRGEGLGFLPVYALAVGALTLAALGLVTGRDSTASGLSLADRKFLRAFERGAIPPATFGHREHVRAAWAALCVYPAPEALARFCAALQLLATRAGKPGLYHETITWAYILLIRERMERTGRAHTFTAFVEQNPDLFSWKPSVLASYYRPEVLESEFARRVFTLPGAPQGSSS
ncbi:MAG TPA: hypothetical protein VH877_29750 [Polyangia bacterium]|nr:hypothetical protein [Polyangia bacterium]